MQCAHRPAGLGHVTSQRHLAGGGSVGRSTRAWPRWGKDDQAVDQTADRPDLTRRALPRRAGEVHSLPPPSTGPPGASPYLSRRRGRPSGAPESSCVTARPLFFERTGKKHPRRPDRPYSFNYIHQMPLRLVLEKLSRKHVLHQVHVPACIQHTV